MSGPPQQYYPPPPGPPSGPPQGGQYYPPPPGPPGPPTPGQYNNPPPQQYHSPPPQHTPGPPQGYPQRPQDTAWNPDKEKVPPPPQPAAPGAAVKTMTGVFNGGDYLIDHRDTNTLLTMNLAHGCPITAKPGAMVAMAPSVTLKGSVKLSWKKLIAGGEISHSTFTGPGEVRLAPPALGDIVPIRLDNTTAWNVGKDAFLACTQGVNKDYKAQGLKKAVFSGEGLFLYKMTGQGLVFVTSLGAIMQKELREGEQYIVDNDHLVAWTCKFDVERIASGGVISNMSSGEGLVCRFTGPGTILYQTRNPKAFGAWMATFVGAQ